MSAPSGFDTGGLRRAVLDAWTASPARSPESHRLMCAVPAEPDRAPDLLLGDTFG